MGSFISEGASVIFASEGLPQSQEPRRHLQSVASIAAEDAPTRRRASELDREFQDIFNDINVIFRDDGAKKRASNTVSTRSGTQSFSNA